MSMRKHSMSKFGKVIGCQSSVICENNAVFKLITGHRSPITWARLQRQLSNLWNLAVLTAILMVARSASAAEPYLEIISLKPNKIVYDDGEAGTAAALLANPFDKEVAVTLKPTLLWDLEESLQLPEVMVTVPAKGNAAATIPLPVPKSRWGREIRVEALVDGKAVDTGRQFFGVNSDWMDMILLSFPRQACADNSLFMQEEPFTSYTTLQHWFAWAPGDYTENAPPYDEWWSGQAGYHIFKKDIREAVRNFQAKGIHCTFYNNSFSNGAAGLEWARRHPEWVCRERNGMPKLGGSAFAAAKPPSAKETGQMGHVQIDFYDPKVIEWGAENVIESIKMFGWDGMFWDCGGCCLFPAYSYDGQPAPHGQDPDHISMRNHRMFREIVRKEFPRFGIWINGAIEFYRLPFWSAFGNGGGIPTYKDQMSAPQTAMLAEFRHHDAPGTEFSNWRHCYESYAQQRDAVTGRYGTPVVAGYTTPWAWTSESHLGALLLATQMHPANCHQEGTWPMTQFMTRYSAILWARDVRAIADPKPLFTVESSRPVWWEKSVYRRPAPKGEDILLHLVNVPETETVDVKRKENPPSATGKVTFSIPAGKKLRKVFALQPRLYRPGVDSKLGCGLDVGGAPAVAVQEPDPKDPAKRIWVHKTGSLCRGGPSQVELAATIADGKAAVTVPAFVYHTLLVFRLEE